MDKIKRWSLTQIISYLTELSATIQVQCKTTESMMCAETIVITVAWWSFFSCGTWSRNEFSQLSFHVLRFFNYVDVKIKVTHWWTMNVLEDALGESNDNLAPNVDAWVPLDVIPRQFGYFLEILSYLIGATDSCKGEDTCDRSLRKEAVHESQTWRPLKQKTQI